MGKNKVLPNKQKCLIDNFDEKLINSVRSTKSQCWSAIVNVVDQLPDGFRYTLTDRLE